MPCRDYYDEPRHLRERCNELARHACIFATALHELSDARRIPIAEIQNWIVKAEPKYGPQALRWWKDHKEADARAKARKEAEAALKKQGHDVIKSLTEDQRKALKAVGVSLPEVAETTTETKKLVAKKKVAKKRAA